MTRGSAAAAASTTCEPHHGRRGRAWRRASSGTGRLPPPGIDWVADRSCRPATPRSSGLPNSRSVTTHLCRVSSGPPTPSPTTAGCRSSIGRLDRSTAPSRCYERPTRALRTADGRTTSRDACACFHCPTTTTNSWRRRRSGGPEPYSTGRSATAERSGPHPSSAHSVSAPTASSMMVAPRRSPTRPDSMRFMT